MFFLCISGYPFLWFYRETKGTTTMFVVVVLFWGGDPLKKGTPHAGAAFFEGALFDGRVRGKPKGMYPHV